MRFKYLMLLSIVSPLSVFANTQACEEAHIVTDGSPNFALAHSIFAHSIYQDGSKEWHPDPVSMIVLDKLNQPIKDCDVVVKASSLLDGKYFPITTRSDENGMIQGWWIAGTKPGHFLEATIVGQTSPNLILGSTSYQENRTVSPSLMISYFNDSEEIRSTSVDFTAIKSTPDTLFHTLSWYGDTIGDVYFEHNLFGEKKISFVMLPNAHQSPEIIEDNANICHKNGMLASAHSIKCTLPFDWQENEQYSVKLNISTENSPFQTFSVSIDKLSDDNSFSQESIFNASIGITADSLPRQYFSQIEETTPKAMNCGLTELRQATFSNVVYGSSEHINDKKVALAKVSRPYIPFMGGQSLCFNYGYGKTEFFANKPSQNDSGFYLSTGGAVAQGYISEPLENFTDNTAIIDLEAKLYTVSDKVSMIQLNENPELWTIDLNKYRVMSFKFDNDNFIDSMNLPELAHENNALVFENKSDYQIHIDSLTNSISLEPGTKASLLMLNGAWTLTNHN
ncbi:hypothetical protein [Thorsellia anophelis]|uniref:Uncharacterized protein n=1 Tax=Thorsellia anophelis DSM 18579 TaxID=1123402 RepID=A0A1I0BKB0_9GAMM|nr:hypothetical protein [Thorsellia anophelis]SET07366.1 hypothetical protein SAMN02583745_01295 [Thorsellia anophelis DSM 18579]